MEQPWTIKEINDQLADHRQQGDPLADRVFQFLQKNDTVFRQFQELTNNVSLLQSNIPAPFNELRDEVLNRYEAFDQKLLEKGHLVFEKYTTPIMAVLALYSLPYCYAGEQGSKVLVQSKYLVENPRKRLEETGEFLFAVGSREAFRDEGFGFFQCLKVRLLHAGARYYATIEGEVPVNQEDLLGTNLAFSLIVVRGLQKMGVELSSEEKQAYMYLWNCVGRLLGIESDWLPVNMRQASILERVIRKRQFRPNEAGKKLTEALLAMYKQDWPFTLLKPEDMIGGFLGKEVASCVGLNADRFLPEVTLTSLKVRNSFIRFSADNFPGIQKQMARRQMKQ